MTWIIKDNLILRKNAKIKITYTKIKTLPEREITINIPGEEFMLKSITTITKDTPKKEKKKKLCTLSKAPHTCSQTKQA